jgi:conjugal transfer pilus assembly protein TrbC
MKILPHLLVIASITGAAAMAGAAAQTSEPELDLEAIRARAKVEASEADALAASARARAEAVLSQANDSAAEAQAHGKRYTEQAASSARPGSDDVFDFDKMVADAGTMTSEGMGEAPRFIAFASLSMPPAALRAMIDDVAKAGGVVVLRGLPGNSAKALTAALAKSRKDGEQAGRRSASTRACSALSGSRRCPPMSSPAATSTCATGSIAGRRFRPTTG